MRGAHSPASRGCTAGGSPPPLARVPRSHERYLNTQNIYLGSMAHSSTQKRTRSSGTNPGKRTSTAQSCKGVTRCVRALALSPLNRREFFTILICVLNRQRRLALPRPTAAPTVTSSPCSRVSLTLHFLCAVRQSQSRACCCLPLKETGARGWSLKLKQDRGCVRACVRQG